MPQQYEVSYSIYDEIKPGKAMTGSSLTQNLKMIVIAPSGGTAQSMVQAMNGGPKFCRTYGAWPVSWRS